MTNEDGVSSGVTPESEREDQGAMDDDAPRVKFYMSGGSITEENYQQKLMYSAKTSSESDMAGLGLQENVVDDMNYMSVDMQEYFTSPSTASTAILQSETETELSTTQNIEAPGEVELSRREQVSLFCQTVVESPFFDYLVKTFSGLYALILIILGLVISVSRTYTREEVSQPYFILCLYLYVISICFLATVIFCVIRGSALHQRLGRFISSDSILTSKENMLTQPSHSGIESESNNTGSFYLRLAAIGFGIGSMITTGLQIGEFLEILTHTGSVDAMIGLTHVFHLLFTFTQLYFMFSYSKLCFQKCTILFRFGLMHLVATNVCVWFSDIVTATLSLDDADGNVTRTLISFSTNSTMMYNNLVSSSDREVDTSLGKINQSLSPYLYPCSIQYSFICSGVACVMWKNISSYNISNYQQRKSNSVVKVSRRSKLSVDCTSSSKGLFFGVFLLVITVIISIIFIVLQRGDEDSRVAAFQTQYIADMIVGAILLAAVSVAFWNMRNYGFDLQKAMDLEEYLLIASSFGIYMFYLFNVVASYHVDDALSIELGGASVITMIQATLQTVMIFCGLRIQRGKHERSTAKSGRQATTFLLVSNMALFGVDAAIVQDASTNPVQIQFLGILAWHLISHIAWPLVIFYRIQSTVCLSNVWKHCGEHYCKPLSTSSGKLSTSEC